MNTIRDIQNLKNSKKQIVAVTAYDFMLGRLAELSGEVDVILVGDSVGTTLQGQQTSVPVTLEEMLYHTRIVARSVTKALLVGDMPFLSYQVSIEQAITSAGRFLKEGGAHAVKLEGGAYFAPTVRALTASGIPVMGHVGILPQSVNQQSGYRIQGKTGSSRDELIQDSLALAEAGAFAIVLEGVEASCAEEITKKLSIPTIGIGSGKHCDGQIIVSYDMLGITRTVYGRIPGFVTEHANIGTAVIEGFKAYAQAVRESAK